MRRTLLYTTLIAALTGCSSLPSATDMANADFGREIPQSECELIVKQSMQNILKDPYSAQYQFGVCTQRGMASVPIAGLPKQYGYFIPVHINARNSFGGYTGHRLHHFLIKNGEVIRKVRQDEKYDLMFPF